MTWRISLVILVLSITSCSDEKSGTIGANEQYIESAGTDYLIEVDELLEIANNPNIKILDFRKPEFYNEGHLKGALNIWRTDIEDMSYAYKGMMAGREQLETLFSNLGISNNDSIIIYDDNALCDASRLWWLLQNYDLTKVRLFHGGITAWKAKKGAISTEVPIVNKTSFKVTKTPSMRLYVSKDEMLAAVINKSIILDARTTDEYSGKIQKKGSAKAGRIPNSKLIDWADAVNFDGDKKLKPKDELQKMYSALIDSKIDTVIVYCHSGVRSAHTTFVLTEILGYKNVKNYDGSWTEWSQFNDLPYERDTVITLIN
ncbi:MAG: thiosulfate/3-mercaptopyruvate sulfurtransferase [Marivirga sp.]|jgi:thiosulfate/3-mercaptopyruvate sulfurtransferase